MVADQESLNRATFDSPDVLGSYTDGWSDLGERRMVSYVATRVKGRRVLDVGVGIGRTTVLLTRRVSPDYVGLDLSPTCVERCRERFPDLDFRLADARDLSEFADGTFGLVTFSYNGIDLVDHAGRDRVLSEMVRVAADDGLVAFSTFNLDSFYARARPWLLDVEGHPLQWHPRRTTAWLRTVPGGLPRYGRTWRNWWRVRRAGVEGDGWAIRPLQIHEFGALAHFSTLREVRREVAAHGLVVERIFSTTGDQLADDVTATDAPYVHVVARKAGASA
jgi:SAM-dependent methyltransferase